MCGSTSLLWHAGLRRAFEIVTSAVAARPLAESIEGSAGRSVGCDRDPPPPWRLHRPPQLTDHLAALEEELMRSALETTMMNFLAHHLGAECIDKLVLTKAQMQSKKADFLLGDRSVIVEVKAISDDRESAVRRIIERRRAEPDWPTVYWQTSIHDVLSRHPRGQEIHREIYDAATATVEGLFRKANRQIRNTKITFGLDDAVGVVTLLNNDVNMLDPRVLASKVAQLMMKGKSASDRRFRDIDIAIIVDWSHSVVVDGAVKGDVIMTCTRHDVEETESLKRFQDDFMREWARFRGVPIKLNGVVTGMTDLDPFEFRGKKPPTVF